jgi:glycosyltransferase involved in cell wall biosynthesis
MTIAEVNRDNVMVSVCMITYNHEKYIREAIEGVLMQKADFIIELIIGEDFSTDNTRIICQEYSAKHPDKIRLLASDKNLGMMPNFVRTTEACIGKYIALCDGDDYWTDPNKLKKQVDFLQENEDFVICHHNMQVIYENNTRAPHLSNSPGQKDISTIEDLARLYFIYTASSIYRNGLIKKLPEIFHHSTLGDYFLYMLIAQYGRIKYFPDVMGVYRVHENGIWSKLSEDIKTENQLKLLSELIKYFKTNESVCNNLKIRYIEFCQHLINECRFDDEKRKNEVIHLLNEIAPSYYYDKYIDISEKFEKLSGSRKNLIKALIKKQLYHSKRHFSHKN